MTIKRFLGVTFALAIRSISVLAFIALVGIWLYIVYQGVKTTHVSDFLTAIAILVGVLGLVGAFIWAWDYPVRLDKNSR